MKKIFKEKKLYKINHTWIFFKKSKNMIILIFLINRAKLDD